jgi:hypothetical protein
MKVVIAKAKGITQADFYWNKNRCHLLMTKIDQIPITYFCSAEHCIYCLDQSLNTWTRSKTVGKKKYCLKYKGLFPASSCHPECIKRIDKALLLHEL